MVVSPLHLRATPVLRQFFRQILVNQQLQQNARINCIISLPVVSGSHPKKSHDFHEKLMSGLKVLETMSKLNETKDYVRNTLDKLQGIRADLVRSGDSWKNWGILWASRRIEKMAREKSKNNCKWEKTEIGWRLPYKRKREQKTCNCVYCEKGGHKSSECKTAESISERRLKPSQKNLCFNCTKLWSVERRLILE